MRTLFLLLCLSAPVFGADPAPPPVPKAPTISGETKVLPYKLVRLKAEGLPSAAGLLWDVSPDAGVDYASPTNGPDLVFVAPPGVYRAEAIIVVVVDGKPSLSRVRATVTIGVPEPPKPPAPPVPPTPPAPPPLTSLRVIFVTDDKTLTSGEVAAVYGQDVRDWLEANTTPTDGGQGVWWAHQAAPGDNLPATWKALWSAVQPKLTAGKAVVIERNGTATIEPLPGSAADMLALLSKYKGDK